MFLMLVRFVYNKKLPLPLVDQLCLDPRPTL